MIYYKCFVCGIEMESPSCLIGRTEKCPECSTPNWVPHDSFPGCELAFLSPEAPEGSPPSRPGLRARVLAAMRKRLARP